MLWELKQAEARLDELDTEIKNLSKGTGARGIAAKAKLSELNKAHTAQYVLRQKLLSQIQSDPALTRALDERRKTEAQAVKPLPEAERGVAEMPGKVPAAKTPDRETLQASFKAWKDKSVTERSIENSKLLEQNLENEPE